MYESLYKYYYRAYSKKIILKFRNIFFLGFGKNIFYVKYYKKNLEENSINQNVCNLLRKKLRFNSENFYALNHLIIFLAKLRAKVKKYNISRIKTTILYTKFFRSIEKYKAYNPYAIIMFDTITLLTNNATILEKEIEDPEFKAFFHEFSRLHEYGIEEFFIKKQERRQRDIKNISLLSLLLDDED